MPYFENSGDFVSCLKSVSGVNISLGPDLQSEEMTVTPQAMASSNTFGKPSNNEEKYLGFRN